MSYNLRADAKGRKGRRSNANVVAEAKAKAIEGEGMDDVVATGSLHETGEHDQRKTNLIRPRAGPPGPERVRKNNSLISVVTRQINREKRQRRSDRNDGRRTRR